MHGSRCSRSPTQPAGPWPSFARHAALSLAGARPDEGSLGLRLLADIRDIFAARATERLSTEDLLRALIEIETAPWPAWWSHRIEQGDVRGAAPKLARVLKPYRVEPRAMRIGAGVIRGYQLADFAGLFERYLAPVSVVESTSTQQRNIPGQRPDPPMESPAAKQRVSSDVALFQSNDDSNTTERAHAAVVNAFGPVDEVD